MCGQGIPLAIWNFVFGHGPTGTGDLLVGIGTLLLGYAAIKGDVLKIKEGKEIEERLQKTKFQHERFLNKMRLAREALRIFTQVKADIMRVRSPLTYEGDEAKLKSMPEDNELVRKAKKNPKYGIKLLKLDEGAENWAEFNKFEPEFKASFGETDAFDVFRDIRWELLNHIRFTLQYGASETADDSYLIYATGSENDERTERLNQAIKKIESLCHPVLRGESDSEI